MSARVLAVTTPRIAAGPGEERRHDRRGDHDGGTDVLDSTHGRGCSNGVLDSNG